MWAADKAFIEAFIEPETVVNEMSVVVVDEKGEFIRRRIGGPKGIDAVGKLLQCDVLMSKKPGTPNACASAWNANVSCVKGKNSAFAARALSAAKTLIRGRT